MGSAAGGSARVTFSHPLLEGVDYASGFAFLLLIVVSNFSEAAEMQVTKDIPYIANGHERHVLDIYAPAGRRTCRSCSGFMVAAGRRVTSRMSKRSRRPSSITAVCSSPRITGCCRMSYGDAHQGRGCVDALGP